MGVKSQHYCGPSNNATVSRETIKKIVETAYWKAEQKQWHTKDERQTGCTPWTGGNTPEGAPEDSAEEMNNGRWSKYRKQGEFPDTEARPLKKGPIIPTAPPHPVGKQEAANSKQQGSQNKWKKVIQKWVEEVREEDEKRKKGNRKRLMN